MDGPRGLGTSSDALGSLLSDLGGVEGSVFARPKTLVDMRTAQGNVIKPVASTKIRPDVTSRVVPQASTPSHRDPGGSSSEVQASDSAHSLDELELMLKNAQMSSQTIPPSSTPVVDGGQNYNLFKSSDLQFSDNVEEDPFFLRPTGAMETAARVASAGPPQESDPLDIFGGAPVVEMQAEQTELRTISSNDDSSQHEQLFEGMASQERLPSAPTRTVGDVEKHELIKDTGNSDSKSSVPRMGTRNNSTGIDGSQGGIFRQSGLRDDSSNTRRTSHRAFELLDNFDGMPETENKPASRPGRGHSASFPLEATPPSSSGLHHHGTAADGVAEIGHRAAKAFQFGTQWFMRASKQIAKDVSTRIEKSRQAFAEGHHHHQSNRPSNIGGPAVQPIYYDWAAQLSRVSPGTKAAALGAMQEEDRLEVQRIMDEDELGRSILSDIERSSEIIKRNVRITTSQQTRSVEEELAPPSYEDLVKPSSSSSGLPQKRESVRVTQDFNGEKYGHSGSAKESISRDDIKVNNECPPDKVQVPATPEADLLHMDSVPDDPPTASASFGIDIESIYISPSREQQPSGGDLAEATTSASSVGRAVFARSTTVSVDAGRGTASEAMIGLEASMAHIDVSEFAALYNDEEEDAGGAPDEPEVRRILRQRRLAERHDRMMKQLAEKRAREVVEETEKAGKVAFRDSLRPKIEAWTAGKKDNIRALLSTLHTVLWPESGWTAPGIADMVDPGKVKKWYMKANLVVHPDKVKQKGGTLEQVTTADMVFDVLKAAWGKFEASK